MSRRLFIKRISLEILSVRGNATNCNFLYPSNVSRIDLKLRVMTNQKHFERAITQKYLIIHRLIEWSCIWVIRLKWRKTLMLLWNWNWNKKRAVADYANERSLLLTKQLTTYTRHVVSANAAVHPNALQLNGGVWTMCVSCNALNDLSERCRLHWSSVAITQNFFKMRWLLYGNSRWCSG